MSGVEPASSQIISFFLPSDEREGLKLYLLTWTVAHSYHKFKFNLFSELNIASDEQIFTKSDFFSEINIFPAFFSEQTQSFQLLIHPYSASKIDHH